MQVVSKAGVVGTFVIDPGIRGGLSLNIGRLQQNSRKLREGRRVNRGCVTCNKNHLDFGPDIYFLSYISGGDACKGEALRTFLSRPSRSTKP
jgi:hypothetical protein